MAIIDRCICCGEVIPEGRMVCPSCERDAGVTREAEWLHNLIRAVTSLKPGEIRLIGATDDGVVVVSNVEDYSMLVDPVKRRIKIRIETSQDDIIDGSQKLNKSKLADRVRRLIDMGDPGVLFCRPDQCEWCRSRQDDEFDCTDAHLEKCIAKWLMEEV